MIVAFSLMRRRHGIDRAAFDRHWLDPHGTLVRRFPRLRRYSQNRILGFPAPTALARGLGLDGIAELAYDTDDDQEAATLSPQMVACDRDSPAFIGAVVRIVAEAQALLPRQDAPGGAKLIALVPPSAAATALPRCDAVLRQAAEVTGWVRNTTLRQRGPNSAMPVIDFSVATIDEVWFRDMASLHRTAGALDMLCGEAVAGFAIEELRLIG
jgi:uncharacterized protein (TIGR02118 family)